MQSGMLFSDIFLFFVPISRTLGTIKQIGLHDLPCQPRNVGTFTSN